MFLRLYYFLLACNDPEVPEEPWKSAGIRKSPSPLKEFDGGLFWWLLVSGE